MDDWSVSDTARAAANGKAPNPTKPVTLTQARFFMDDFHLFEGVRRCQPPWSVFVCVIPRVLLEISLLVVVEECSASIHRFGAVRTGVGPPVAVRGGR